MPSVAPDGTPIPTLAEVEAAHIREVWMLCGGNISEAARLLGLYRSSLQRRLRRLGLR